MLRPRSDQATPTMSAFSQLTRLLHHHASIDEIAISHGNAPTNERWSPFWVATVHNDVIVVGIPAALVPELWSAAKHAFRPPQLATEMEEMEARRDAAKVLLLVNPENLDAWNCLKTGDLEDAWKWSNQLLARHSATSMGWAHRRFIRDAMIKQHTYEAEIMRDLEVGIKCASRKAANYFAWTYRITLLGRMSEKQLEMELETVQRFLRTHISDRSAFCYYEALLGRLPSHEPVPFAISLLNSYPGHETLWCHLRFLCRTTSHLPGVHELVRASLSNDYRNKMDREALESQARLAASFYYWCKAFSVPIMGEVDGGLEAVSSMVPAFIKQTRWFP